jgi:hypothetical protein
MNNRHFHLLPSIGLLIGSVLGLAGSFAPSASLRTLLWGIDGLALVMAAAMLVIYHLRKGNDLAASGFLVFLVGETLIVGSNPMTLEEASPIYGAGISLWATALILVSLSDVMPKWTRITGVVAAILFLATATHIFIGDPIHGLSKPLPFFIYALFVLTLIGWAWHHYHESKPE